jgi:riboflavin synthase
MAQVTGSPTAFGGYPAGTRALQLPDTQVKSDFLASFGRPPRILCDAAERSSDPTISQALHVINGDEQRSTLGQLRPGDAVNLERAVRADGRLGGHIVQGHVDGVGRVRALEPEGDGARLTVEATRELLRYVVEKGSITVDGISLTVAEVLADGFAVAVIPHTLAVTTLGTKRDNGPVNLEVDIVAKYVERLLDRAEG